MSDSHCHHGIHILRECLKCEYEEKARLEEIKRLRKEQEEDDNQGKK